VTATLCADPTRDLRVRLTPVHIEGADVHRVPTGQLIRPDYLVVAYTSDGTETVELSGLVVDPRTAAPVWPGDHRACGVVDPELAPGWVVEFVAEHRPDWALT
jgi:hypothetical protein